MKTFIRNSKRLSIPVLMIFSVVILAHATGPSKSQLKYQQKIAQEQEKLKIKTLQELKKDSLIKEYKDDLKFFSYTEEKNTFWDETYFRKELKAYEKMSNAKEKMSFLEKEIGADSLVTLLLGSRPFNPRKISSDKVYGKLLQKITFDGYLYWLNKILSEEHMKDVMLEYLNCPDYMDFMKDVLRHKDFKRYRPYLISKMSDSMVIEYFRYSMFEYVNESRIFSILENNSEKLAFWEFINLDQDNKKYSYYKSKLSNIFESKINENSDINTAGYLFKKKIITFSKFKKIVNNKDLKNLMESLNPGSDQWFLLLEEDNSTKMIDLVYERISYLLMNESLDFLQNFENTECYSKNKYKRKDVRLCNLISNAVNTKNSAKIYFK